MIQKLTKEQALVISGFTGILCCGLSEFHKDVEERMGRPVWTHEFASDTFQAELKDHYRKDFLAMVENAE